MKLMGTVNTLKNPNTKDFILTGIQIVEIMQEQALLIILQNVLKITTLVQTPEAS